MRKFAPILLLTVILLAFLGPSVYYPVAKTVHRAMMHKWLKTQPPAMFTRLVFSAAQAKELLADEENEFDFEGKRYDVIKTENNGDLMVVYCVNDKDEEALYAKAFGMAGDTSHQLSVIKSVSLVLYCFSETQEIKDFLLNPTIEHTMAVARHYRNYSGDILCPPPQA